VGLISIDRTIKEMAFPVKDEATARVQNDGLNPSGVLEWPGVRHLSFASESKSESKG
jgi:hypothetical protein